MADKKTYDKKTMKFTSQEENFMHLQPQALEMEEAVLGALMVDSDAYAEVSDLLQVEAFYEPKNQLVFKAIRTLSLEQKPIDVLTVIEKLKEEGELEKAGGLYYVTKLSDGVSNAAHVGYYAGIVAQKFLLRQLISVSSVIQTEAFDDATEPQALMQKAEGLLFELSQRNIRKDYTQIDPVIQEAFKKLQEVSKMQGGMTGIASGFRDLDKMTSGWQNSNLVILAARPAMGKTAFALCMAKNIAIDQRIPMAFFSLEMSNLELVNRLISNVCQLKGEKIRSGQLDDNEWGQLDVGSQPLYGAPLYIDDTSGLSIQELRTKARRLVREVGVKIIMIDYLQLMTASGMKFGSRQEEVAIISRNLKGLAKELNVPIIALSQVSRKAEERNNIASANGQDGQDARRPQLSDLRESGSIEQDADMVLFIHRPEYYGCTQSADGTPTHNKAEIIIAKHRNGAVGVVYLKFRSEYAIFTNKDDTVSTYSSAPIERMSRLNSGDDDVFPPDSDPLGGGNVPMPTSTDIPY